MIYSEFVKLVKGMKSIWTYDNFLPDEYAVKMWYTILKDVPYEEAVIAVQRYANTSRYAPTPADIREQISSMKSDGKSWADGWEQVLHAIRKFGYYNEKKALESMDELTRSVVKNLGWKQLCMTEQSEMMAYRANFRMAYEDKEKRNKEEAKLPQELKEQIIGLFNKQDEGGKLLGDTQD